MMYDTEFDLSEQLSERGISRIAKENKTIVINYNEKSIRFNIDHNNWMRTIKNFEGEAKGIINDLTLKSCLKTFLNKNYNEIAQNDNTGLDDIKNNGKQIVKIFKYSNCGKITLHEAIILNGKPVFIKYNQDNQRIEIVEKIVETTRIIRPPSREEYPYTPYEFTSIDELGSFIEKAKTITLDELYIKCKSIFLKYIDQDNHIIILLTTDSIWTYFQDLFPTTHYFEGVGTNDVGKSSIGYTFEYTAYRAVKATAISGPNYYRLLGPTEPGQCVIIEDEGDGISEDPHKVTIFKAGYELDSKVPKINMNIKDQEQNWYYAYCYKVILAEKSLNPTKARGVIDRTFSGHCKPGNPKQSIKNIVNNKINKSPKCLELYNELSDFRKLMLCYRLVHYNELLPEIDTGLKNRDNELCNPILQLFYGTQAINEIIPTLEIFVKQRRERRSNSLEAALYPIIKNIINLIQKDSLNNNEKILEVYYSEIWNAITEGEWIEGNQVKLNQYETLDYGILYQNSLSKFISDKFGAKIDRKPRGSILIFDQDKFDKFEEIYGNDKNNSNEVDINVKLVAEEDEKTVNDLSEIDNNQLQKIDEEDSNNKKRIDVQSDDDSKAGISVDNEGYVGYVGNVGILERASTNMTKNQNEILTNKDSMKDNSRNNNLPIFNNNYNYNNFNNKNEPSSLSENDKKDNTHPLEPTQPTLPTSSVEESSKLQCLYCDYKGMEIDLDLHIYEKHRDYLRGLERDSPDFNVRTDYIVEQIKLQQQRIRN